MQIATKTSKNTILPVATAAPSPLRPARPYTLRDFTRQPSIRGAPTKERPAGKSQQQVRGVVQAEEVEGDGKHNDSRETARDTTVEHDKPLGARGAVMADRVGKAA